MGDQTIRTRHWTRIEYDRLIESGFLQEGDRVELLGGQLMVAEPQGSRHSAAIGLVAEALHAAFGSGWYVMVQAPLALDDESEPEPDVAVVRGSPREYRDAHPSRPVLVVEVTDSSIALDRELKASLYARVGVPEYWIVSIPDRIVEMHRQPAASADAAYGWRYADIQRLGQGSSIAPLAASTAAIAVAAFLL